jgi:hypothetical protein
VPQAAGWQYIGYSPPDPNSLRRGYLRYDRDSVSLLGIAEGVVDVLVTPRLTALLFSDRVQVLRRFNNAASTLGPADAVLPTHDRTGVLLINDRDPSGGAIVRRVDLDGHVTAPAFRLPPGSHPLAETAGRGLVLRESNGALTLWDPRSSSSRRVGMTGFLDSVVGRWAVTHELCGGDACRYRLCPLDGTRSVAVALPRRIALLGAPVLSSDGEHFAIVANVFARYDTPEVALGVATIRSGGADVRFIAGVPYSNGQQSWGARPAWTRDGSTVYQPRPLTGEVVAYQLGARWAQIMPYHLTDASRIWL